MKTAKNICWPAFGCAKHPKTGKNSQHQGKCSTQKMVEIHYKLLWHCRVFHGNNGQVLSKSICSPSFINVTSFSSIPYYSNVRLILKKYLEQNSRSITLDTHASTVEHPPHLFCFKPHSAKGCSLMCNNSPPRSLKLYPWHKLAKLFGVCFFFFLVWLCWSCWSFPERKKFNCEGFILSYLDRQWTLQ